MSAVRGLRTIILHGPPFARGVQHGRRLRDEIRAAVEALREAHGRNACVAAAARADAAWPAIRGLAPAVAEEIEGIAVGADAARTDILLRIGFEFFDAPPLRGCTALAVNGPDGAIVAQNWDAPPEVAAELALFLHIGADGLEVAIVASAGGLAWVGCNRDGLALVNNDLMLGTRGDGLPSQVVRRLALSQPNVGAAIAAIQTAAHMGGRSYLLGDAHGAVGGVEVSAACGVRIAQARSPVLHTNHALHPEVAADQFEERLMATYPSSRARLDRLRALAPGQPDLVAVKALLADRSGFPDSIAKAPSAGEPTATLFSVVFDCGGRTLYLCPGAPGQHPFEQFAW